MGVDAGVAWDDEECGYRCCNAADDAVVDIGGVAVGVGLGG